MLRPPPRSTRTYTRFPYTALVRSLDALPVRPAAQRHMVRRPLVAEGGGNGGMNLKGRVGEGEAKLRERARPFVAAVRHGDEVRDREVAFAVGAVGGGGDGRGVRGPHRRCRP